MIDLKSMLEHEKAQDVILFLSGRKPEGISHPQLDGYYSMYGSHLISNVELIYLVKKMCENGLISSNGKGGYRKGSNWELPKFASEKKYGIK
ncbi:hypothetical protein [Serratia entomophila]|uniref:hypothetical protein n=1 Tax=Serratia entomophila TaxID=42906 RepID=UPI0021BAFF63|nr:hypothetical protein [Serratia entomophila]